MLDELQLSSAHLQNRFPAREAESAEAYPAPMSKFPLKNDFVHPGTQGA